MAECPFICSVAECSFKGFQQKMIFEDNSFALSAGAEWRPRRSSVCVGSAAAAPAGQAEHRCSSRAHS